MHTAITNEQVTINSRDVKQRIEALWTGRHSLVDVLLARGSVGSHWDVLDDWDAMYLDEFQSLQRLQDQGEHKSDWYQGVTLIRDSYFVQYAMEQAEREGAYIVDPPWPMNCIDWKRAARALQKDYIAVEFDDALYWVHA